MPLLLVISCFVVVASSIVSGLCEVQSWKSFGTKPGEENELCHMLTPYPWRRLNTYILSVSGERRSTGLLPPVFTSLTTYDVQIPDASRRRTTTTGSDGFGFAGSVMLVLITAYTWSP
jgi:hypothetical protein